MQHTATKKRAAKEDESVVRTYDVPHRKADNDPDDDQRRKPEKTKGFIDLTDIFSQ